MSAKLSPARGLVLAAAVCAAVVVAGCGSGGPDPTPGPSNRAEVAIREYLNNEFSDESWYWDLYPVTVRRRVATAPTSLGGGARGRAEAREICRAVLGSRAVARVVVRYGHGLIEGCSL